MYFHHRKHLFYSVLIVLALTGLFHLFMGVSLQQFVFILAFLSGVTLFGLSYYWKLEGSVIIKYTCFKEVCRECRNNQGITIGRYLHKTYKIKLMEKEKITFFNT